MPLCCLFLLRLQTILKNCDIMYKKVILFQINIVSIFSSLTLFGMGEGWKIPSSTLTFHNFLTRNNGKRKLADFLKKTIRNNLMEFFD